MQQDNIRPALPTKLSVQDIITVAEDGAGVVGNVLSFISGLIHNIGHVNHPLMIDKIAEALSHIDQLNGVLKQLKDLDAQGKPTVPTAGDMP